MGDGRGCRSFPQAPVMSPCLHHQPIHFLFNGSIFVLVNKTSCNWSLKSLVYKFAYRLHRYHLSDFVFSAWWENSCRVNLHKRVRICGWCHGLYNCHLDRGVWGKVDKSQSDRDNLKICLLDTSFKIFR